MSGNLIIGSSAGSTPGINNTNVGHTFQTGGQQATSTLNAIPAFFNRSTAGTIVSLRMGGSQKGRIFINATGVSLSSTSSDYRLKTNITPMTGSFDRIKQLNPCKFNWLQTGGSDEGFLAHEIQSLLPNSVLGTKDQVATQQDVDSGEAAAVGDPIYQTVDYAALTPLLTAAMKEIIEKIESLTARIEALES